MENTHRLDELDWQILAHLARNGRMTQHALSEAVGRSPTAVARRQAAMEDLGVIAGYEAKLDLGVLGHGAIVYIKIALGSQRAVELEAFEEAIMRCQSVVRCDLMSGTDDYLVTLLVRSLSHFAEIHRLELSHLPGVARMESGFVLREVVKTRLPPALMNGRSRKP